MGLSILMMDRDRVKMKLIANLNLTTTISNLCIPFGPFGKPISARNPNRIHLPHSNQPNIRPYPE